MNENSIDAYKINGWSIQEDQTLVNGIKWMSAVTDKLKRNHWNLISAFFFEGAHTGQICKRRFNKIWKPKIQLSVLKVAEEIKVVGSETMRFLEINNSKVWTEKDHQHLLNGVRKFNDWSKIAEKQLGAKFTSEEAKKTFDEVWKSKKAPKELKNGKGKWLVQGSWDLSLKRKSLDLEVPQEPGPAKRACLEEETANIDIIPFPFETVVNEEEYEYTQVDDELIIQSNACELLRTDKERDLDEDMPQIDEDNDLYEDNDSDFNPDEPDDLCNLDPDDISLEDLSPKKRNLSKRSPSPIQKAGLKNKWTLSEVGKLFEFLRQRKTQSINWQLASSFIPNRTMFSCKSLFDYKWKDIYNRILWAKVKDRDITITVNRSLGTVVPELKEGREYKVNIKLEGPERVEWSARDDELLLEALRRDIPPLQWPYKVKGRHPYYECYDRAACWKACINMEVFKKSKDKVVVKSGRDENYLESPKLK